MANIDIELAEHNLASFEIYKGISNIKPDFSKDFGLNYYWNNVQIIIDNCLKQLTMLKCMIVFKPKI